MHKNLLGKISYNLLFFKYLEPLIFGHYHAYEMFQHYYGVVRVCMIGYIMEVFHPCWDGLSSPECGTACMEDILLKIHAWCIVCWEPFSGCKFYCVFCFQVCLQPQQKKPKIEPGQIILMVSL